MRLPFHNHFAIRRVLVASLVVFISLWPMNSAFSGARIMGILLTPQRVLLPALFLFVFSSESKASLIPSRLFDWRTLFYFWLSWGVLMGLIEGYSNHGDAIKELLAILLSFMLVFIIHNQVKTLDHFYLILTVLKWLYIGTVLFGIFETITGYHLSTSAHYVLPGYSEDWYQPTAQFYGVNDYCAYLALFSPILLYRTEKLTSKLISSLLFLGVLYMMVRDDAVISIIGVMTGLIAYLWVISGKYPVRRKLAVVSALIVLIVVVLLWTSYFLSDSSPLSKAFRRLVFEYDNFKSGTGSMYQRISMYGEMLKLLPGRLFLGYGPASLSTYVTEQGINMPLINPHNYHLELIFSYGLPFYIFLLLSYAKIIKNNSKLFQATRHKPYSIIVASCFILPIISIAPSGFIGYLYPWIVFAMGGFAGTGGGIVNGVQKWH